MGKMVGKETSEDQKVNNIKINPTETECKKERWMELTQINVQ
jgi:hypothetical protein